MLLYLFGSRCKFKRIVAFLKVIDGRGDATDNADAGIAAKGWLKKPGQFLEWETKQMNNKR